MLKIVHCADIHIGASFGRLPSALALVRAEEQRSSFMDMINYCKEKQVDALLICGDLFDSPKILKKDAEFVKNALSSLSPIPVFIIAGNHDYMCAESPYMKDGYFSNNVHIFPSVDYSFEIPEKSTVIYGKSYDNLITKASFTDISPDDKKINIICLHGDLNPFGDYNPIKRNVLSAMPFNYAAFGHIHNGELFKVGNVKCAYSGTLEGTGFDDDGFTGFIYAEISREETKLFLVSLSRRHYHNISYDISGDSFNHIVYALKKLLNKDDLFKITLTGEHTDSPDILFLKNELESDAFYLDIEDNSAPSYDFDEIEKEESLRGEFLREMRKLSHSEEEFIRCGKVGLDALSGKIPNPEVEL